MKTEEQEVTEELRTELDEERVRHLQTIESWGSEVDALTKRVKELEVLVFDFDETLLECAGWYPTDRLRARVIAMEASIRAALLTPDAGGTK